jgi:hypothetical protein
MKILVSSRWFANQLRRFDFETECINKIYPAEKEGVFVFETHRKKAHISLPHTEINEAFDEFPINQCSARWDWVRDLLNEVHERPVILEITPGKVRIIFDC